MAIRNIRDFEKAIKEMVAYRVRERMNKDLHVLVFREVEFRKLIRIHKTEIDRIISLLKQEGRSRGVQKSLANIYKNDTNVSKAAAELYHGFIKIFDETIKEFPQLQVNKHFTNSYTSYTFFPRKKQDKDINVYKVVQKVQTRIREKLLNNSKKGASGKNILSAVVIVGVAILSEGELNLKQATKIANQRATGAQLGHTRGAAAVAASDIRQILDTVESNASILRTLKGKATTKAREVDAVDARLTLNNVGVKIGKSGFKGEMRVSVLSLESTKINNQEGTFAKELLDDLRNFVLKYADELFDAQHSKSYNDVISDSFIELFLKGKRKTFKYKNKRIKIPVKVTEKVTRSNIKLTSKSDIQKVRKELIKLIPDSDANLNKKIPYLNRRLHDKIRENMGGGESKLILNYRTGRFAASAKITRFLPTREKNAATAVVRYMRYPYGTFEPGGRLHKPGRDPHRIFGRSIRQLLQEEKIATFRRVVVGLRG